MSDQDDQLFAELAYLGSRLHWSLTELLDLEHPVRQRFIDELARDDGR